MELYMIISCLLLCFFFLTWIWLSRKVSSKLPPGPGPLQIIGNSLELGAQPHKSFAKLAKVHGPIISLKLGQRTTIVFSSATTAKQVLQKHDPLFSNRKVFDATRALHHHEFSLPWLPAGPQWRNLRKICNSHIFSNQKLEETSDLRHKKVDELVTYVEKCCRDRSAIDIGRVVFDTSMNVLSTTILSVNIADPDSDTGPEFMESFANVMEDGAKTNLSDFFPFLRNMDLQGIRGRMTIHMGKMLDVFQILIDERLQSRKRDGCNTTNDVLDGLLNLSENNSDDFKSKDIKHLLVDLFVAGTDTTPTTVEWAMTELLRSPEALSKTCEELDRTIGRRNRLKESDISTLPYLQAVIKETFRLHPAAALLVPRQASENVEIDGYVIPTGAEILVNVWAIGRDPDIWENPQKFLPERFLGSDIDVRGQNFELTPFGGGRRICPGMNYALRMVHLVLGQLLNSFDWSHEGGIKPEELDMEDKFGFTLRKAQPLRAVPISI